MLWQGNALMITFPPDDGKQPLVPKGLTDAFV